MNIFILYLLVAAYPPNVLASCVAFCMDAILHSALSPLLFAILKKQTMEDKAAVIVFSLCSLSLSAFLWVPFLYHFKYILHKYGCRRRFTQCFCGKIAIQAPALLHCKNASLTLPFHRMSQHTASQLDLLLVCGCARARARAFVRPKQVNLQNSFAA